MASITRQNPHLEEIIEILDMHRSKYHSDAEARDHLTKDDNEWIDKELLLCITDKRYFISNYFAYRDEKEGFKGLYPLFDSQEILYEEYRRLEKAYGRVRALVLKARQMGSTTYNMAEFFAEVVFSEHINAIAVGKDESQKNSMFTMFSSALDFLPWWMKPRIKSFQTGTIIDFDEKDEALRATRPGLKTIVNWENANKPSGVGRGQTFGKALLDELAFWFDGKQLSKSLFPTFNAPDGFYVMASTANGRNDFWHNLWRRAEAGKIDWHPIFIPFYRRDKTYSMPILKTEVFVLTDEEKQMREKIFEKDGSFIRDETFKWMRSRKEEFIATDGDDMMFSQEYTCLIGKTRISTNEGLIKLIDLQEHEGKLCDGNQISVWKYNGIKPTFRAMTKLGYSIVGTDIHRVPTFDAGDVELHNLVGHTISLSPPEFGGQQQCMKWGEAFNLKCSIEVDESIARFLGYFLGDGCYGNNAITICCDRKYDDVIEDVRKLMVTLFGNCYTSAVGNKRGGVQLRVGSVDFRRIMKKIGIWNPEKPHRKVVVPEAIFRSPISIIREFLRGLFESDGFCAYEGNRVSLFSKWKDFLRDIQLLLLGFGITSRLTPVKKTNEVGKIFLGNALELRAAEARRFCEEIGFISNRKRERQRIIEKKVGRPQAKIEFRDEVVSIIPEGDQEVFDITVVNSHQFSANGILVHNCDAEESFQSSAITAIPRGIINRYSKLTLNPLWVGEINYDFKAGKPELRLRKVEKGEDLAYPETDERFHVWMQPERGAKYATGIDVSLGNPGGDYSCIQVLKLGDGHQLDEQVAVWHGLIDPESLAEIVLAIGWWYNEALAAVEVNSMGMTTNTYLVRQYEYENIYRFKRLDRLRHFMTDIIGWWTDEKSKRALLTKITKTMRDDQILIRDRYTIDEFRDFTEDGALGEGAHDDYVMALCIALYCGHEGEFNERQSTRKEEPKEANKFYIMDRFGTRIAETNSQNEAERISKKHPGSSIQRIAGATALLPIAGKKIKVPGDLYNTDYSPIHDKEGTAHKLHYDEGIPEDEITPEMIAEFDEQQEEMENNPEAWKYQ